MNRINILVTGCGGGGIGEQVIKCLRLSALDIFIIATDITPVSKGKIDADEFVVAPLANAENYMDFILKTCVEKNVAAIVPGSEIELKMLSAQREVIERSNIQLLINSEEVIGVCLDKNCTSKFLIDNNFLSPSSFAISNEQQLESISVFPLVLKPSVGGGGSVNTMIAQNREELKVFGKFLLGQYKEFIAQEYVGDANSEYTVGVLSTKEGVVVDSIVLRRNITSGLGAKIRQLNSSGKEELGKYLAISSGISQGEIIRNETIAKVCEEVAQKLKSVGPLNVQCRLVGTQVYIFEINPRFSGTSPMRALAGFNELEITLKNKLFGEKHFERINYRLGHVVRGLNEFFV